jgi:hypothetical protein
MLAVSQLFSPEAQQQQTGWRGRFKMIFSHRGATASIIVKTAFQKRS